MVSQNFSDRFWWSGRTSRAATIESASKPWSGKCQMLFAQTKTSEKKTKMGEREKIAPKTECGARGKSFAILGAGGGRGTCMTHALIHKVDRKQNFQQVFPKLNLVS